MCKSELYRCSQAMQAVGGWCKHSVREHRRNWFQSVLLGAGIGRRGLRRPRPPSCHFGIAKNSGVKTRRSVNYRTIFPLEWTISRRGCPQWLMHSIVRLPCAMVCAACRCEQPISTHRPCRNQYVMESDNRPSFPWIKSIRAITRVDILVFDGFALPEVSVVIEIFHKANALIANLPESPLAYEVTLLSAKGGRIASSSSVLVWTERMDCHSHACGKRLVFIAGGAGARDACRDQRMVDWISRKDSSIEMTLPIGEGRCLLEAAGLSNPDPSSSIDDASLGETYTVPAQTSAPAFAALTFVGQDFGTSVAKLISVSLSTHQPAPSSDLPDKTAHRPPSENIKVAVRWMEANISSPISIDAIAKAAAMSERTFLRRFKKETGLTPSDYLLRARLNLCCRMLLETRLPVDKVARRCGLSGGRQLSTLFRRFLSTTPTAYRDARKETPAGESSS